MCAVSCYPHHQATFATEGCFFYAPRRSALCARRCEGIKKRVPLGTEGCLVVTEPLGQGRTVLSVAKGSPCYHGYPCYECNERKIRWCRPPLGRDRTVTSVARNSPCYHGYPFARRCESIKKGLAQVNPQLHDRLATINANPS